MYSSTESDTPRPVVRLGTFEHVVSPSRPEEQEVDYDVMARDYVKMARWDYRSGNRTPSQVSCPLNQIAPSARAALPSGRVHKNLTPLLGQRTVSTGLFGSAPP